MSTKASRLQTSLFDHLPVAAELLEPVYTQEQTISDFTFKALNQKAKHFHAQHGHTEVEGKKLLSLYPYLLDNGAFHSFASIISTQQERQQEVQIGKTGNWYEATYTFFEGCLLITYQDISSKKELELQKQKQQNLWERLLELTDLGIDTATAIRNQGGQIIDFVYHKPNKKGLNTHQLYQVQKVEGKSMLELYPHLKQAGIFDLLVRAVEEDIPYSDEVYVILNGTDRWFYTNYSRLNENEVIISYLDVTDRKKAELAVKENEQFINSIFNATNVGISALGALRDQQNKIVDFEYLRTNKKSQELRPKNISDITGRRLLETFPNVLQTGIFDILVQVVESGKPYCGQLSFEEGGYSRWFEVSYGKFGDGVLLSYSDITPLKETEARLHASESLFRSLIENLPDTVVRHNLKLQYIFINKAFEKQTGLKGEDFLGKTPHDFPFHPEETEKYIQALQEAIKTQKPTTFYGKLRQPNGEHYIYSNIAPEFNSQDEVESLLVITRDITELKTIETNLRLSEQRLQATKDELKAALEENLRNSAKLQALINSTTELICALDDQYRFIGFNDAFHKEYLRIFGVEPTLGESMMQSLGHLPEEQMNAMAMWSRALKGNRYTLLQEYGDRKLERNYYEMTFAPIFQDNAIIGASCLVRNVSNTRKIEKELKDAEEFLYLAENLPQLIFTKKSDGQLDYVNQAFYRYTGLSQIAFPSLNWEQLIHPGDYPTFVKVRNQHIFGDDKTDYILELRLKDYQGQYQWMVLRMIPLFDNEKNLSKWLGTLSNIDLAKNAELKQRQAAEEFKQLTEGLPQLVWMADGEGATNYYNQKWLEYAGYIPESGWNWGTLIHPDDLDRTIATWKRAVAQQSFYEIEYRLKSKDGSYRWFLGRSLPIRNLTGLVIKWFGTCTDIHDRKMQQLQLEQQNKKLSQLNEYLDTFVHSVAHDLRAPVVNIMGLLDLFEAKSYSDKDVKLVQMLSNSVKRLDSTLKGMIKLIELQSIETASEELSIEALFRQVMEDMSKELDAIPYTLESNFEACQNVYFISSYLESAFRNLISNAIKYKKPDEPLQLKVSCSKEANFVLIHFSDNGIGIELDRYKNKLFKPFQRFTKQAEGKGIGLHLIHNMFARQGGKVTVESKLHEGTTFTLYIPV